MQVLCHDFGAKRAFLLKAAGPAKLLIYFQDFRSFSNPGIRRFLTDLDLSAPPPPPLALLHPFCSGSSPLPCSLALIVLASAVCQLEPFLCEHIDTHTQSQTYPLNMGHTLPHVSAAVCVRSPVDTPAWTLQYQHGRMLLNDVCM